jgi:hypothetical protein
MGGTDYNYSRRSMKTTMLSAKGADGQHKVKTDQIFESNKRGSTHESMLPTAKNKAHLREARDTTVHPLTVPIIIALDITGSMGDIPDHLIREGLPKIVSKIMEKGVADPAIMIMAVGDSKCDNNNGVFQLGQFESGDAEMDMWLERIWISQGGGGNGGESYNWPYYYALHHVETDAWEKRKQKGFIFTIGDDHCHTSISNREIDEVMGDVAKVKETVDTKSLVDSLKEKWNVYHIELGYTAKSWKGLLGSENVVEMGRTDYDGMANKIADIVVSYTKHAKPASDGDTIKKTEPVEDVKKDDKPTTPTML